MDIEETLRKKELGLLRRLPARTARVIREATVPATTETPSSEIRILELPQNAGFMVVRSGEEDGEVKILESCYRPRYSLARSKFFTLVAPRRKRKAPKPEQLELELEL